MTAPRVVFLVHGGRDSIELVRAQGLASHHPSDRVHFLCREGPKFQTARAWHAQIKALKPDLLYVINTTLPGLLLAPWWRRKHGLPYIIDTGDVVYEMARSSGSHAAWKLPLLKRLEEQALCNASVVVVRGSEHQSYLRTEGLQHVELIRDGYSPAPEVAAQDVSDLRSQLGLEGRFVAGVMGSLVLSPKLQICYGWDLVQALAHLPDPSIHGLIIGDGPGRPWLEELARRHQVTGRLTFCGRIPYAEVPLYLRLLDVALSTQTNNLAGRVRTTGKLPEYMAAERFILASRVGEATRLLPAEMLLDYEGEVDAGYPQRLAKRLRELCSHRQLLDLRHTLPAIAAEHCAYDVLSRRFSEVVRRAVPGSA
jgi:glycosyltransferase involved in cell wall biosynthesis